MVACDHAKYLHFLLQAERTDYAERACRIGS